MRTKDLRIQKIHLNNYKRFKDLQIIDLPDTAKLVVLLGPNGVGKSCLFDAFLVRSRPSGHNYALDASRQDYYLFDPSEANSVNSMQAVASKVSVELHETASNVNDLASIFHIRSPYRNQSDLDESSINRPQDVTNTIQIERIIDPDSAVSNNFARLVFLRDDYIERDADENVTIGFYREQFIRDIQEPMKRLFGGQQLTLQGFGGIQKGGTFWFDKASRIGIHYKNLSGGEKAAFDLLLDLFVHRDQFADAIYCIDEPEAHIATALHGRLLDELLRLIPSESQLWIATHSIGFVRKAYELELSEPGSVAFIDFSNHQFDEPVVLEPRPADRSFWNSTYEVALDDLSQLITPRAIILCEGKKSALTEGFDSACYNVIFENIRPDALFLSRGGSSQVENSEDLIAVLNAVAKGAKVTQLIDRDGMSDAGREEKIESGLRVLRRRELENYLFDFDVIKMFLKQTGNENQSDEVYNEHEDVYGEGDFMTRDIKSKTGQIFETLKRVTDIDTLGRNKNEFAKFHLIPALLAAPIVLEELREDVFGLK